MAENNNPNKKLNEKIANREGVNPKEIAKDISQQMKDTGKRAAFVEIAKKEDKINKTSKNGKPSKVSYIVVGIIVILAIIALWLYRYFNPLS